jgi:hypothetical protein
MGGTRDPRGIRSSEWLDLQKLVDSEFHSLT